MKLVVINGSAQSGKDEFITFIQKLSTNYNLVVFNESTIDPVKKAMTCLGMSTEKTPENRIIMHKLKMFWLNNTNGEGCVHYVKQVVKDLNELELVGAKCVFIHCREPKEIKKIVAQFPNSSTLLINSIRSKKLKNGADDVVDNYIYDITITNDDSLDQLEKAALHYIEDVLIK